MSQGSLIIPTTGTLSGLELVQATNAALANLSSRASGATDPSTLPGGVAPFSFWADTSVNPVMLRQRNTANSGWITVGDLTKENWGLSQGPYRVCGLFGDNNATSPNTKFDFTADAVTLRNPTTGAAVTLINAAKITCDIGLAGAAENGRDQGGAFGASSWVHFYYIWNGVNLRTISSASAPAVGPTLPAGYAHWAYIGVVRLNASSQLVACFIRGAKIFYAAGQILLSGGSTTDATAINVSTAVPPNAASSSILANLSYSDTGTTTLSLNLYVSVPKIFAQVGITSPVAGMSMKAAAAVEMPNVGSAIYYSWDTGTGNRNAQISVLGYTVPNGG